MLGDLGKPVHTSPPGQQHCCSCLDLVAAAEPVCINVWTSSVANHAFSLGGAQDDMAVSKVKLIRKLMARPQIYSGLYGR